MSDVNIAYNGGYGEYSFNDGVNFYNTGRQKKAQGHDDDAKIDFSLAEDTFRRCSGQHHEAAQYLRLVQQELRNLG
jgi:hypothetical protein